MRDMFTTNEYKVLQKIYDNSYMISGRLYCPLSQMDVANDIGLSRAAINRIFSRLQESGDIKALGRSKWQLSDEAANMIKMTEKL